MLGFWFHGICQGDDVPQRLLAQKSETLSAGPENGSRKMTLTALIGAVVITAILHVGQDIFLPLAVAMLLTFAISPLVNLLRNRGLPRMVAVLSSVAITFAAIGLFILVVVGQLGQLAQQLPTFQANITTKLEGFQSQGDGKGLGARFSEILGTINTEIGDALPSGEETAPSEEQEPAPEKAATGLGSQPVLVRVVESSNPLSTIVGLVAPLIGPIGTTGLVIVVVIFMLLDKDEIRDRFIRLVGSNDIHRTTQVLEDAGSRVANYLLMQLLVNLIYAVPIGVGLWFIGVPNAVLWGLLTLVLRFIPYIGSVLAAAFPLFLAFAVTPDWSAVIWTAALFLTVELLTSNIIEPWLYGARTGVSSLAIIIAAIFWSWIWGPMGLVMSTPLTVCLVVLGRHIPQFEVFDVLFGDEPVLAPHARLYQRLLVGDVVESSFRAEEALEEDWIADYHRDVGLPALMLAQADYERGLVSREQEEKLAVTAMNFLDELEEVVVEELEESRQEVLGSDAQEEATDEFLPGEDRRVMFIGGRNALDDAAARMAAQAARSDGAMAIMLSHDDLATSRFESVIQSGASAIVLSFLDLAPARGSILQVRRLKKAMPDVRVGVALWRAPDSVQNEGPLAGRVPSAEKIEEILATGADFCVSTLEEALDEAFSDAPVRPLAEIAKKTSRRPLRRSAALKTPS